MPCGRCNAPAEPTALFCTACGTPLARPAGANPPAPGAAHPASGPWQPPPGYPPPGSPYPPPYPPPGYPYPPPGSPYPPKRTSGFAIAAMILGGLMAVVMVLGILAAIAIPNFIKYQLRSKAMEAPTLLSGLVKAEASYRQREGHYVDIAVPDGVPGHAKLSWSGEALKAAGDLDWLVEGDTYYTYRVDSGALDDGTPTYSACAEADLDGDGVFAAYVVFVPAVAPDGSKVAPTAPCAHEPETERPLELQEGDPEGKPIKVTPDQVF